MKKNMGNVDKIIRIVVALALIVMYITDVVDGTLGLVLVAVSVIFVLTSFIGFCPAYTILGMNTCKLKK